MSQSLYHTTRGLPGIFEFAILPSLKAVSCSLAMAICTIVCNGLAKANAQTIRFERSE